MPDQSPVYLVVQLDFPDLETYFSEYGQPLAPLLASYDAEVLVAAPELKVLEGTYDHNLTAVIKFPSAEVAERFYQSSEYQPLKAKCAELTNTVTSRLAIAPAFTGLPA